jgi:hypothetical protein
MMMNFIGKKSLAISVFGIFSVVGVWGSYKLFQKWASKRRLQAKESKEPPKEDNATGKCINYDMYNVIRGLSATRRT